MGGGGGVGGGEIVSYPKLFPHPYSIALMFLGTPLSIMLKDLRAPISYIVPKWYERTKKKEQDQEAEIIVKAG